MAWIYLAESAVSPWPWNPGSDQLPTVKTTDGLKPVYCPVCTKDHSPTLLFGMTLVPCPKMSSDPSQSISFTADSLVSLTQARLEPETNRTLSLGTFSDLLKKSTLSLSLQKTHNVRQSKLSQATVKSLGTKQTYWAQRLPPWALHLLGEDIGPLPRPTATANQLCPSMSKWGSCRRLQKLAVGLQLKPEMFEWLMGYPIGWTVLGDAATRWYRPKRGKRS